MEFWTCDWPPGIVIPPGLGLLPRDGLSGVCGGLALLAGEVAAVADAEEVLLLELFDPELEFELPPPHRAFVTRSITDVLPLGAAGVGVAPAGDAASPAPPAPLDVLL